VKRRVSSATEMDIGKYLAESTPRKKEVQAELNTYRTSQSDVESDLTDVESSDSTSVC